MTFFHGSIAVCTKVSARKGGRDASDVALYVWRCFARFAGLEHNSAGGFMHLNRPQGACKVVLVNEVFSLGPGETKTIVEDLDVSHYDRIVYKMDATKLLNNFVRSELLFFQHSMSSCKAYVDVRPDKPNAVEVLSTNGLPKLTITIGTSSEGGKSTHDTVEVFASGCESSSSSQKSKREKGERNESHWHCF